MTIRPKKSPGFSLFELLVVLVLLALAAGIAAPSTARFLDGLRFREQTAQLLSGLRYARLAAIGKGREVHLTLTGDGGRILSFSGAIAETKDLDLEDDASLSMDPPTITFYPEGQATPARLTSTKGKRRREITLNPLTALPRILS